MKKFLKSIGKAFIYFAVYFATQLVVSMVYGVAWSAKMTAELICKMGADGARIYPTVVFFNTELCSMTKRGEYTPLDTCPVVMGTKEAVEKFFEVCKSL